MKIGFIVIVGLVAALTVLMCLQESKKRKISFVLALLICVLATPLFGYFILLMFPLRNPVGCKWCGNAQNEAEYCGICHKNAEGQLEQ